MKTLSMPTLQTGQFRTVNDRLNAAVNNIYINSQLKTYSVYARAAASRAFSVYHNWDVN